MKPFILTYDPNAIGQPAVTAYLDSRREVKNWYTPYLGAVLLVSEDSETAESLTAMVRRGFPALLFAIVPIEKASSNGWMPKAFWALVLNPISSGRWDDAPPLSIESLLKGLDSLPPPPPSPSKKKS